MKATTTKFEWCFLLSPLYPLTPSFFDFQSPLLWCLFNALEWVIMPHKLASIPLVPTPVADCHLRWWSMFMTW